MIKILSTNVPQNNLYDYLGTILNLLIHVSTYQSVSFNLELKKLVQN
jgi:hypothetical protein